MLDKEKIQPIFVVRTISHHHEDLIPSKSETNIQGRHIGESPSALFRPRFEIVRSDRPLFFPNHTILIAMRTNKSELVSNPSVLLESLTPLESWNEVHPEITQTINKLLLAYLHSDLLDSDTAQQRRDVVYHVQIMLNTTEALKSIENANSNYITENLKETKPKHDLL